MKKPLFSLICAFALLVSGCSKEESTVPKDEELYPVTFNVSTFSKEIVPMASTKNAAKISASATSGGSVSDAIRYIKYGVYNEVGTKVNSKDSYYKDANFGKIDDSLPKGKYKIVFLGSLSGSINLPNVYPNDLYYSNTNGLDDIFLGQIELEVTGSSFTKDVKLNRVVGKIEINLVDQIPGSIEEIAYAVKGVATWFNLTDGGYYNNGTISKSNFYWDYEEAEEGPDYTQEFGLYFFLAQSLDAVVSVNVRAYDRNRNLVVDKTINDVPVSINKKTILTGRLFDGVGNTAGQAFSISVDDKWNSESNHVEF